MTLRFVVPGVPVPLERARRDPKDGHWYTPAASRAYAQTVGFCCQAAMRACRWTRAESRVAVVLDAYCVDESSDADNHAKVTLDAMQKAGVYRNDKLVRDLHVRMHLDPARPRLEVTVDLL